MEEDITFNWIRDISTSDNDNAASYNNLMEWVNDLVCGKSNYLSLRIKTKLYSFDDGMDNIRIRNDDDDNYLYTGGVKELCNLSKHMLILFPIIFSLNKAMNSVDDIDSELCGLFPLPILGTYLEAFIKFTNKYNNLSISESRKTQRQFSTVASIMAYSYAKSLFTGNRYKKDKNVDGNVCDCYYASFVNKLLGECNFREYISSKMGKCCGNGLEEQLVSDLSFLEKNMVFIVCKSRRCIFYERCVVDGKLPIFIDIYNNFSINISTTPKDDRMCDVFISFAFIVYNGDAIKLLNLLFSFAKSIINGILNDDCDNLLFGDMWRFYIKYMVKENDVVGVDEGMYYLSMKDVLDDVKDLNMEELKMRKLLLSMNCNKLSPKNNISKNSSLKLHIDRIRKNYK